MAVTGTVDAAASGGSDFRGTSSLDVSIRKRADWSSMNKSMRHPNQWQMRCGFSLVELLIVLAVLAVVAGIVLPSLRSPLDKSRLTGAAKELQASLAKARSLAIRQGSPVYFRYEIAGDRYVIERAPVRIDQMITVLEDPSEAATTASRLSIDSAEASTQSGDGSTADASTAGELQAEGQTSTASLILREGKLPTGVTFAEPFSDGAIMSQTRSSTTTSPQGTAGAGNGAAGVSGAELLVNGLRRWSDPICFQPSGRAQDAAIRVTGQRDFVVDVTLRGFTAMASYSAPTRIVPQQAAVATGMNSVAAGMNEEAR